MRLHLRIITLLCKVKFIRITLAFLIKHVFFRKQYREWELDYRLKCHMCTYKVILMMYKLFDRWQINQ